MEGIGLMRKHCQSIPRTGSLTMCFLSLTSIPTSDPDMSGEQFCDVNDIAEIVLFLCSDAAKVVNGATWTADGGVTAA